jgi:hypothetical protein
LSEIQQKPSILFPSKLGRLEIKPHEPKKRNKTRGKTKDDKNQIKKREKAIKH